MSRGRFLLKIPGIILGVLLGLVILALVALQVVLHTSALDKIALKVLSSQVDGDVSLGDITLSRVLDYPRVTVDISDLLITYPHDKFARWAGEEDEGRSPEGDTLLQVGHLYLSADAAAFIKQKRIDVDSLILDRTRAFAHRYDSAAANWSVVRFLNPSDKEKDTTSTFHIDEYKVGMLQISQPRLVYEDVVSPLSATVDFASLNCGALFHPYADSARVDATLQIKDLLAGDLVSTLGATFSDMLAATSTDAVISLDMDTDGILHFDSLSELPPATVSLDIPESHLSLAGYFENARLCLSATGENTDENIKNVDVSDLDFHLPGIDLGASGGVQDLLGSDPLFRIDADASAQLQKLLTYMPKSVRNAFRARGNVNVDLNGQARLSQLNIYRCYDAEITGHVKGDIVEVSAPRDSIGCYLAHPDISLGTMKSAVDASDRALAVTALIDSVDFDLGSTLCARGKNMLVFAQNASKAINDSSMWHPFAGKVTADRVLLDIGDSLAVRLSGTQNKFTATPSASRGKVMPNLRLESINDGIFFRNAATVAAARGASVTAAAQMRSRRTASRDTTMRRRSPARDSLSRHMVADSSRRYTSVPDSLHRRLASGTDSLRRRQLRDSVTVPDFLSEKDFRMSDIHLKLSRDINNLLTTWNPSGQLHVSRGIFASPAFPLKTRFSGIGGSFKEDHINIDSMRVVSGTTDVSAMMTVDGLKKALMRGDGTITVKAALNSDRINLNEIITAFSKGQEDTLSVAADDVQDAIAYESQVAADSIVVDELPAHYKLFVVPANLVADVSLNAAELDYSTFVVNNFRTDMTVRERCAQIVETRASSDMGSVYLDAFYSTKTKKDISVGFGLQLSDVTADKVIDLFPKVDEVVPMLKSFKGKLDCEMAATTQLDTNMNFLLPTLNGMFKIGGRDLVLEDIGSLRKITNILMFKDKAVGHIDDMTVNGVISDNMMEVFPFILSVDRYTLALQGVQNLNKSFDYHVSLIKSPLLLKLGVNIFGESFANWKYRLGKPKYRNTKIPLFTDEVDNIQLNLVSSIKNVFSKGVDRVLAESHEAQAAIDRKKRELSYDTESDLLSPEEQDELEHMMIEQELEEETAALSEEIDRIIAEML